MTSVDIFEADRERLVELPFASDAPLEFFFKEDAECSDMTFVPTTLEGDNIVGAVVAVAVSVVAVEGDEAKETEKSASILDVLEGDENTAADATFVDANSCLDGDVTTGTDATFVSVVAD